MKKINSNSWHYKVSALFVKDPEQNMPTTTCGYWIGVIASFISLITIITLTAFVLGVVLFTATEIGADTYIKNSYLHFLNLGDISEIKRIVDMRGPTESLINIKLQWFFNNNSLFSYMLIGIGLLSLECILGILICVGTIKGCNISYSYIKSKGWCDEIEYRKE